MNYKKMLRRYAVPDVTIAVDPEPTHTLSDDEVESIIGYFEYLQTEFFTDIPVSKDIDKSFIYNIPKDLYKFFEYQNVIEAPPTANPFIMLYGLCLKDIEQYPNFLERYLEINAEEIDEFHTFIESRKQDLDIDVVGVDDSATNIVDVDNV